MKSDFVAGRKPLSSVVHAVWKFHQHYGYQTLSIVLSEIAETLKSNFTT